MVESYSVGVLGCTGAVGQRFMSLLALHPFFKLTHIGASSRSAGRPYHAVAKWRQSGVMPAELGALVVQECRPELFSSCDLVFSGLDSDVAGEIELAFADANIPVFSNARNYRMDPLTPLLVPVVNAGHLDMVREQRRRTGRSRGFIATNSNCATVNVVVPLKALQDAFGPIKAVSVVTMQAVSGAGYPGVASLDIMDNVVPYISGEEDKLENETAKILGGFDASAGCFKPLDDITVSAQCNRVPVLDGHMACVSIKFANEPAPSPQQVEQALLAFKSEAGSGLLDCYSAPAQTIHVFDTASHPDRPQPRLDRDLGAGYTVSVGRVRPDPLFDIKFVSLSHNTVIGAAGSSILNAEIAIKKELL